LPLALGSGGARRHGATGRGHRAITESFGHQHGPMIVCKSTTELEAMHRAGLIVWEVLNGLKKEIQPGVTTLDLEKLAARRTEEFGVRPAFRGYRGYPCVLSTSVN